MHLTLPKFCQTIKFEKENNIMKVTRFSMLIPKVHLKIK